LIAASASATADIAAAPQRWARTASSTRIAAHRSAACRTPVRTTRDNRSVASEQAIPASRRTTVVRARAPSRRANASAITRAAPTRGPVAMAGSARFRTAAVTTRCAARRTVRPATSRMNAALAIATRGRVDSRSCPPTPFVRPSSLVRCSRSPSPPGPTKGCGC
jgi:hypothetical protein